MKIKAKNVSFHKEYVFTKRPALVYFDDRVGSYPIMYFRRPKGISQEVFNDLIERIGFTIKMEKSDEKKAGK